MNFSIFLLGVFSVILHDICLAKVLVHYNAENEIEAVYAERKRNDRHLAHLATLKEEERFAACKYYRPGEYVKSEESNPHMYEVIIDESVYSSEEGSPKPGSPKEVAEKKPMESEVEEETAVEEGVEKLKLKGIEQEKPESTKADAKEEPPMIYNEDIGFRCQPKNAEEKPFILSYGFAQEMFFVSEPVGNLSEEEKFNGRKMQLKGYMFAPPVLADYNRLQLHTKYYELRERTEKARLESETLLKDIEENDDISALLFQEKNIACACILDTDYYTAKGFQFVAATHPDEYKYEKLEVGFDYPNMDRKFKTDFMKCKAKDKDNNPVTIGITRSYAEGGDAFTSILDEKAEHHLIDVEVVKIPVLINRKYAGNREGVLEVLQAIRGEPPAPGAGASG